MFTLKKDIPQLYQWDSNIKLIVEDDRINQVQFSQRFSQTAVCVEVENGECFIPNEFLQSYYDIFAYACVVDDDGQVCEYSEMFSVYARPKPDNYIYTPTEILNLKHIEDELNKKFEALAKEVNSDMETAVRTRPQELTEEEKSQARKNIGAISSDEDRGAYYITITKNGDTYTADKTFKEINEAIKNNLFPYVKLSANVFPLVGDFSDIIGVLTFGASYNNVTYEIVIAFDDQVMVAEVDNSPNWDAQLYDGGYIENRTHGKVIYKSDTEEKNPDSFYGSRQLTDSQESYLQSIGANTESSKELSFVLPQNDVNFDKMAEEYDYDNYEPPSEDNTEIQIAIQDSSGIITATPSFTVSEIKVNDVLYGWSFNFTDNGFAENYLKCVVMLLKNVPYNGYIRRGIWLPNYTGSPKKGYGCKITYECIKKVNRKYLPEYSGGTKAYKILRVDKLYYDNEDPATMLYLDSIKDLKVGQECSVILTNNYNKVGKIKHIPYPDKNCVSLDCLIEDYTFVENKSFLWIPDHPEFGTTKIGEYSFSIGNNKANLYASFASGEDNIADGKRSFVAGKGNYAGYQDVVFGQQNTGLGFNNFIAGNGNTSHKTANNSFCAGYLNNVRSDNGFASGFGNHCNGKNGFVTGQGNNAGNVNCFAGGEYSQTYHKRGFVYGHGLLTGVEGQTVFGDWNDVNDKDVFQVGIGTGDSSNRKNGLALDKNGNLKLAGFAYDKTGNQLANVAEIVPVNQGTSNAGKFLGIGDDGVVVPMSVSGGGGSDISFPLLYETTTTEEVRWIDTGADAFRAKRRMIIQLVAKATSSNSSDITGCGSIYTDGSPIFAAYANYVLTTGISAMLPKQYDKLTTFYGYRANDGAPWIFYHTARNVVNGTSTTISCANMNSSVSKKDITGFIIGDCSAAVNEGTRVFGIGTEIKVWGV